jgi:predicted transcriptional regulator
MANDLHDLKRLKISSETRAWLQAEAHTTKRSQQEIAREALHEIALRKIQAAKVLTALAPAEGQSRDTGGRK